MAVTPQTNASLKEIADALRNGSSFGLCGHVSPDGDCLGGQLALAACLRRLGKEVVCLLAKDEPFDEALQFLPGAGNFLPVSAVEAPPDVFVAVDVPTIARMGDACKLHERARLTITIDHHANDERVSDLSYVDPDAAAASMIVWELAKILLPDPDEEVAVCCYTGLMTDTGCFRFQNADTAAFKSAAEMVAAGADPALCACEVYQNRSLASLRLMERAMARAVFVGDGSGVLSWVSAADLDELGAGKPDVEPIVDLLRSIKGVRIACMLREQGSVIRGSLRAKDSTDVSALARSHGGGGHVSAAGFTLKGSLDDACALLLSEIEELVQ